MRKNIFCLTLVSSLFLPIPRNQVEVHAQISTIPGSFLVAANTKTTKKVLKKGRTNSAPVKKAAAAKKTTAKKQTDRSKLKPSDYQKIAEKETRTEVEKDFQQAISLIKNQKFEEATLRLFQMSRSPKYIDQRMQVRYLLGLSLFEMGLYQVAAFQFISVIRDGESKYVRQSLEKLSLAADKLNDDTILNYAMSKVNLSDFPKTQQNMLRFRIGEIQLKTKLYDQAVKTLSAVTAESEWFSKSKYLEGLANTERGALDLAEKNFTELVEYETPKGINHPNRVSALMGLARVSYQMKNWDQAIELYREVPRDSELWHDSLFEISWAQMRAAQFRNVLSNFHSLHSAYYEDFYIPESLLLRSIVYLYICQYDEMEKTLNLFEHIYKPVLSNLTSFLKAYSKPLTYYDEVASQEEVLEDLKKDVSQRRKYRIPFLVARHVMKEGDYSRIRSYIKQINKELTKINTLSSDWKRSDLANYSRKLLTGRLNGAKKVAGNYVRSHIVKIRNDLAALFEQHGFARYEMLSGQKEQLKKKIAGKTLAKNQLDEDEDRNYYIQNGYEYWPFSGEYWLDEIGNYHYLGTQRCE